MSSGTKKSSRNPKVKRHSFPWMQIFANSSATNLPAAESNKPTVLPSGELPLAVQPRTNVILFGETGVGKSSVINLTAQEKVAKVSSNVNGCTMESTPYNISFDDVKYTIFDTIGLEEPEMGVNGYLVAIEKAFKLIKKLEAAGGIHLLLFCMRAGRITATTQSNYRMFYECLCDKKVPIALVFTGLERERNMEDWWERNKDHIAHYGIKSLGHACITAIHDSTEEEVAKYKESQKKIRDLIKDCVLQSAAPLPEPNSWFAGFAWGLMGFIKKHSPPGKKALMKTLTKRCGLAPDVAEEIVNMIEKGGAESNENEAERAGNEGNPGVSSQGVEAGSKTAIDGDPPESQGGDQPSQHSTDGEIDAEERTGSASKGTVEGKNAATGDGLSVSQDGAQSLLRLAGDKPIGGKGSLGGRSTPNDIALQSGAPVANASGDSDDQAKILPSNPVSQSMEPAKKQGSGSKLEEKSINTGNARGGGGVSTRLKKVPSTPNAIGQERVATVDNASALNENEAERAGNEGSPGIPSQGVEVSSKTVIYGDPPESQGGDHPPQCSTREIYAQERTGSVSKGTIEGKNAIMGNGMSVSQDGAQSLLRPAGNKSVGGQGFFGGGSTPNDIAPQCGMPVVNASGDSDSVQAKFLPPRPVSEGTVPAKDLGSGSKLEERGINTGFAQGGGDVSTRLQEVPSLPNAAAQKRVATADNASAGSTKKETGLAKNGSGSGDTGQKKRIATSDGVSNSLGKKDVASGNMPILSDISAVSGRPSFPPSHARETTGSAGNEEGVQGRSVMVADEQKGSRPQENTSQYRHASNGRPLVSAVPPKNPGRYESGSGLGSSKGDNIQPSADEKTKRPMVHSGNNSYRFPVRNDSKGSGSFSGSSSNKDTFVDAFGSQRC